MPLVIGNQWRYVTSIPVGSETIVDTLRICLSDTISAAGVTYFRTTTLLAFGPRGDSLSVAVHVAQTDEKADFEVLLQYPNTPTDEYLYNSTIIREPAPVLVSARIDSVDTGVGRLRRVNYSINAPQSAVKTIEFGFSPGIGLVTMRNGLGTSWVLHSYSLRSQGGR